VAGCHGGGYTGDYGLSETCDIRSASILWSSYYPVPKPRLFGHHLLPSPGSDGCLFVGDKGEKQDGDYKKNICQHG
jgi:hypothetical protein